MYELVQVGKNTYYIESPAKIGLYRVNENDVYLIDSGNDKNAGRKVRQILEKNNWNLKAIVNTHSNADHIGGNCYLQQQTGCQIFSNGIETAFTKHPILETSFLYGGYPPKDLRHKFLMANESDALDISDKDFPKELEVIHLLGHFFHMIGLRTPDNVVFLADCITSRAVLEKYQITFIYDVAAFLDTLDLIENMEADIYIPAHTEVMTDIKELVSLNRKKVFEVADKLLEFCAEPTNFESILQKVFNEYGLTMNFEQYVLVGSTVRSFLSWLRDNNKADVIFENNMLLWKTI